MASLQAEEEVIWGCLQQQLFTLEGKPYARTPVTAKVATADTWHLVKNITGLQQCTCIACPVQPFCNLRWQQVTPGTWSRTSPDPSSSKYSIVADYNNCQVAAGDTWHLAKNITGPSANDNGRQREQTKPREERGRCGTLPSFVVVLGCVVGGRGQEEPRRGWRCQQDGMKPTPGKHRSGIIPA
ncbi:hypothetical protein Bbelb_165050 [Branchiostoma belcheri]|nr:hypothetical protein Bbelb_165050 [Branchiostoma belcheri]